MSGPKAAKRQRFSNMTEAEAQEKRDKENKKERNRQRILNQAFTALYVVLPHKANSKQFSKLAILKAAKECIVLQRRARQIKKTPVAKSSVLRVKEQESSSSVQTISDLSLQPDKPVLKDQDDFFSQDFLNFLDSFDQKQSPENTKLTQDTNNPVKDQACNKVNSNSQDLCNMQHTGHVGQIALSAPAQCIPTIAQVFAPAQCIPTIAQVFAPAQCIPKIAQVFAPAQCIPTIVQVSAPAQCIPTIVQVSAPAQGLPKKVKVSAPAQGLPKKVKVSASAQGLPKKVKVSAPAQCLPTAVQPNVPPTIMPRHSYIPIQFIMQGQSIIPSPVLYSVQLPISTPTTIQGQSPVSPSATAINQGYVLQDGTGSTGNLRFLTNQGSLNTAVLTPQNAPPIFWTFPRT